MNFHSDVKVKETTVDEADVSFNETFNPHNDHKQTLSLSKMSIHKKNLDLLKREQSSKSQLLQYSQRSDGKPTKLINIDYVPGPG